MSVMWRAEWERRAKWRSHHDDSFFDGEDDAKNVGILVKTVNWPIDAVLASIHNGSVNEGTVPTTVLAKHASGVDKGATGAKGACIEVVNFSGIVEQTKDNFRAPHFALLAPNASQHLASESCRHGHGRSRPFGAKAVGREDFPDGGFDFVLPCITARWQLP